MQMMILANIPPLIDRFNRTFFVLFVTVMYMSVMFVWLNFSRHAVYWIPYNNLFTRTEQQIAYDSQQQLVDCNVANSCERGNRNLNEVR